MKCLIPILALFLASQVQAQMLRIGVVDSGLNLSDSRLNKHLCPSGHIDFTGEGIADTDGHGTAMVGLIESNARDGDYCLVIYKYYSRSAPATISLAREIEALEQATSDGVKIVNLSSSGAGFNEREYLAIRDNPSTIFVVAAGNEGLNLDVSGNEVYPASYFLKNEIVVKDVDSNNVKVSYSNYSKNIKASEVGENVLVYTPGGLETMSGTSCSTAIHTGKMIRKMLDANR